MTSRNPYRWDRTNPELFFGRDALLAELGKGLLGGASFGLTGGRRMGKTTVLRRLESDLRSGRFGPAQAGLITVPIYIDLHAIAAPLSPDAIHDAILAQVAAVLPAEAPPSAGEPAHPFARALARRIAAAPGPVAVIALFDEIEPLVHEPWGPALLANWRSFLHNEPALDQSLAAVFAGSRDLDLLRHELGSPLANILTWKGLRVFSRDATARLAREPSGLGAALDDAAVDRLHALTGGHPFLAQFVMHEVVEHLDRPALGIIEEAAATFLDQHADKLSAWWKHFDERTRRLYAALVDSASGAARTATADLVGVDAADRAWEVLLHTGVAREERPGQLVAAGEMFASWFERSGRSDLLPPSWQEVDRLLYRVERGLRDLLTSHFVARDGARWFPSFAKRHGELAKKMSGAAKRDLDLDPAPLEFADFGDLFDQVLSDWQTLGARFESLTADKPKRRTLFEERKTTLVRARNAIRHSRMHDLDEVELNKAKAFALELATLLAAA
ncbi:MAG: hypothetical protein U1F43_36445 [Myxococcota bacterium]